MKKINLLSIAGFSFLEVLIALMIMTSAFMGILHLQTLALQQVHASYYQNMAAFEAQALMERLRAEPSAAGFGQELTLAEPDIENCLPAGRGDYQCAGIPIACTASIFWQDHGEHNFTLSSFL
jgi:type IV pilus modification protein PilV